MRSLDGRRRKALTVLTDRVSGVPPLLCEVVLVVHLGGGRVRRLRASHRESGIRIGGILHHGHMVGLGRRTRWLLALLEEMLRTEHIVRYVLDTGLSEHFCLVVHKPGKRAGLDDKILLCTENGRARMAYDLGLGDDDMNRGSSQTGVCYGERGLRTRVLTA
jgi:hypothetical protein